jgi:hypothetical protein
MFWIIKHQKDAHHVVQDVKLVLGVVLKLNVLLASISIIFKKIKIVVQLLVHCVQLTQVVLVGWDVKDQMIVQVQQQFKQPNVLMDTF